MFLYRVYAIIIFNNKILEMRDERSHYYLPGDRVQMGETAERAVIREVEEELNITPLAQTCSLYSEYFSALDKILYR